jgi:hypothetical protein
LVVEVAEVEVEVAAEVEEEVVGVEEVEVAAGQLV